MPHHITFKAPFDLSMSNLTKSQATKKSGQAEKNIYHRVRVKFNLRSLATAKWKRVRNL